MKQRFLKGGLSLLAMGAILAGCSSDELMPDQDKPVDRDTNFYVNVTIANPAEQGTRANTNTDAADYENGTEAEQEIHEILFVFYNSSNQYVGNTVVEFKDKKPTVGDEEIGTPPVTQNPDGSIETVINMTVPVSVAAGSLKPASVMAYVNPTTGTSDQQRAFSQTLGLTRTLEQVTPQSAAGNVKEHDGFTMTNSVYYENTGGLPHISVAIPGDHLFTDKAETSKTENADKKVIIYVERVVAKVTLNQKDTQISQTGNSIKDSEGNEYDLNFNVLGWGLSNLEKATFLIKNFRSGSSNYKNADFNSYVTLTNMDKTTADGVFGDLSTPSWNFPSTADKENTNWGISGHRSFWSISPTYFTDADYPSYADEVVDDNNSNKTSNNHKYNLRYLSFDDIYDAKTSKPVPNKGAALGSPLYALEHTLLESVVNGQQKRAVTCALVIGQYELKRKGADNATETKAFFIRNGIDNDGKAVNVIYPNEETLKKAILSANNRIYVRNLGPDGKPMNPEYSPVPWSGEGSDKHLVNFEIKHPDKNITDNKYTPNRFVALQLKAVPSDVTYYLRDANGTYKEIKANATAGEASLTQANNALYTVLNGVEKYQNGYAYFAVPIKHLWYRDNKEMGEQGFDAKLGQYGIVRNHLYTINVTGIEGIGTGIGDPSVPIIPNVETDKYFVKTEMRVQRWRVVPSQDVVLKP